MPQIFSLQNDPLNYNSFFSACILTYTPIFSPFITNVISETDWNALHYQYGLVLLPIYQRGCAYWSSNYNDKNDEYGLNCAFEISTLPGSIFVGTNEYRHNKCYVRLVQDAD